VAEAKYKLIAEHLREQIISGALQPGSQLPTETGLAVGYDASRSTIRLAIGLLIQQGLVETRQGLGTYVAEPTNPTTVAFAGEEDWRTDGHADYALRPDGDLASQLATEKFQAETAAADAELAAALNIAEGGRLVLRRTHLFLGQDPWSLVVSYYPADIVKGTALEQVGPSVKSASMVLAENGHPLLGYRHEIYVRMPDAIETLFFRLSGPAPVTVVNRIAYDVSRPVRLTRHIYRSDALRLRHDVGSIPV
jgi:GntR family transcriptional regulator